MTIASIKQALDCAAVGVHVDKAAMLKLLKTKNEAQALDKLKRALNAIVVPIGSNTYCVLKGAN